MSKADVGLIGLAVMGQNLALNIASKGFDICVYNRTEEKTKQFMEEKAFGIQGISSVHSLEEFVRTLKHPRKIIIMVKAGDPVDELCSMIVPLLNEEDIIIDGGNSFFKDTIRRAQSLGKKNIHFMGTGISGGEEGALNGPSIMPGGSFEAWEEVKEILTKISAKAPDGSDCCSYLGNDGAGHFVKMVHNGIEYADMQLISEIYYLMRELTGLNPYDLAETFKEWNKGELNSYLIEITADILSKTDEETGLPMVDVVLDKAGQKGTGMWTSREALELGSCSPTIAESVFARYMSAAKCEREKASEILAGVSFNAANKSDLGMLFRDSLYAAKICSYAQGFDILKKASIQYGWGFNLGEIALMWRGGCIIRAQFLDRIKEAYERDKELLNLLLDTYFTKILKNTVDSLRRAVILAVQSGLPVPALSSALSYYDSYRQKLLPANLIQAQRDYFGAHTYERVDKAGSFHTDWKSRD